MRKCPRCKKRPRRHGKRLRLCEECFSGQPKPKKKREPNKLWINKFSEAEKRAYRKNCRLKHLYGITLQEFERKLTLQDKECLLCGSKEPRGGHFVLDHSHATNKVRGIICVSCNTIIGMSDDNPKILELAAHYLTVWKKHGG